MTLTFWPWKWSSVPILVFLILGLSVLELGPMCATDVRQKQRLMPPPIRGGGIIMMMTCSSLQAPHTDAFNAPQPYQRVRLQLGFIGVTLKLKTSEWPAPYGGGIKRWCPSSVCLSVYLPCLTISQERKGIASWKLVGRKPMTPVTRDPVSRSKGQRSQVKTASVSKRVHSCWRSKRRQQLVAQLTNMFTNIVKCQKLKGHDKMRSGADRH